MVLFMLMLCHVCDPPVTHVRTIAICVCVWWTCCAMYYSSFLAEQISHEFRNLSREILVSMFAIGPCKVPIPDAWLLHVHFVPEVCHCRLTAARSRAVLHDTLQSYIIAAAAA